ncbi:hypothetical protein [Flagellimonas pacifica]|uniref:Uncharacterized protein n=1 Tax=Flagellimonas pacifica TaxID=1247520 RepID=A0A285N1E3_9FLAO|nr:hypothetical protein [Allomuricauda parva]SNZ01826.1 hypothetical protein SAMN06265377_3673 [Allomuricauda parva]
MKNTKKVTTSFLVVMFLILGACQPKPKKDEPHEEPREKVKPPEQIISLEESKSLYDNYTRNRVDLIQQFEKEQHEDDSFNVARFSSFDFKTVKQYIAFVEQEAKAANVDVTSLRFYFANYPNKEKFPDGRKVVHPRQNSVFVVPTMNVDGEDYGFYIGEDGKAKLIKDAVGANGIGHSSEKSNKSYASLIPISSAPTAVYGRQSLAMDKGSSGPPPHTDY